MIVYADASALEWPDLMRVPVTETLVARAEALAWAHGLRGYDAVQLASAMTWQDALGQEIVLAKFARQLNARGARHDRARDQRHKSALGEPKRLRRQPGSHRPHKRCVR